MLRAIIGTTAVLAGFGVLEHSVDASTGHAGSCTPTQAYASLQRGETVPVRLEPTPQGAAIGTLSGRHANAGDLDRIEVTMTGSQGGWARIALNTARGYTAKAGAPQSIGWIPADLLAVDTRIDGTITVYDWPGLLGSALTTIEGDDMTFRVLGCRGNWLQVINARYGSVWIDKWCAREGGCRG
jgi:hypothetical protein